MIVVHAYEFLKRRPPHCSYERTGCKSKFQLKLDVKGQYHKVPPICKWSRGIGELITRHFHGSRPGDFFSDA